MNKIDINKKYKTRSGLPVRIYAVDGGGEYPVHGAVYNAEYDKWDIETWRIDLRCGKDNESEPYGLVVVSEYDNFNIDDKVIVWCSSDVNDKVRGHFAGLTKEGKPKVWGMGRTSFTSDGYFEVADYCELAK